MHVRLIAICCEFHWNSTAFFNKSSISTYNKTFENDINMKYNDKVRRWKSSSKIKAVYKNTWNNCCCMSDVSAFPIRMEEPWTGKILDWSIASWLVRFFHFQAQFDLFISSLYMMVNRLWLLSCELLLEWAPWVTKLTAATVYHYS